MKSITEDLSQLTPRQVQIVQMSADGLGYADIAKQFGIRMASAQRMAVRAIRRLEAENMKNAIAICLRRGIID